MWIPPATNTGTWPLLSSEFTVQGLTSSHRSFSPETSQFARLGLICMSACNLWCGWILKGL